MKLTVVGTGSKGNCYLLTASNGETLIIEAGVHVKEIKEAMGFSFDSVVGCIITHEHADHAVAAGHLQNLGIDTYCTRGTHKAMGWQSHRSKCFPSETMTIALGEFRVMAFDVQHDAAEPVGFLIHHKECGKVLFITDTCLCKYSFAGLNNILIEANYSKKIIAERYGDAADDFLKDRVAKSHMSLETCLKTLEVNDLGAVNNIVLIHLSDTNSHALEFAQAVTDQTGKNVAVASAGMVIPFDKNPVLMAWVQLQHKVVKIRKPRVCIMCFRKFEKGVSMVYSAGVMDGDFQSNHYCCTCDAIIEIHARRYREYEFCAGWVDEGLDKGETPEDYLARIQEGCAIKTIVKY